MCAAIGSPILWLGFLGYYLASLLDFTGLQYISASLERLILFLNPTIVVLLSALILGKPITRRTAAALGLSYAGIVLVFAHDFQLAQETAALLIGGGLVFASAITYAMYLVGSGEIIQRVGAARYTAYGISVSALFVFLQFLATRPLSALTQPVTVYWTTAGMAHSFPTVLPIWLTNEAIRRVGSNRVALIGTIGLDPDHRLERALAGRDDYPCPDRRRGAGDGRSCPGDSEKIKRDRSFCNLDRAVLGIREMRVFATTEHADSVFFAEACFHDAVGCFVWVSGCLSPFPPQTLEDPGLPPGPPRRSDQATALARCAARGCAIDPPRGIHFGQYRPTKR